MKAPSKPRRVDREGPIHRAILNYLRLVFPHARIAHPPNESRRPGPIGDRERIMNAANGVSPGIPDLLVFLPDGRLLAFEVKAEGGYPTEAQRSWLAFLSSAGHRAAVVRSIDDVEEYLARWGIKGRTA